MYNIDFLPQLEKSRKYLFGLTEKSPREVSDEAYLQYSVPEDVKIIPCKEDTNGEYVPSELEEKIT